MLCSKALNFYCLPLVCVPQCRPCRQVLELLMCFDPFMEEVLINEQHFVLKLFAFSRGKKNQHQQFISWLRTLITYIWHNIRANEAQLMRISLFIWAEQAELLVDTIKIKSLKSLQNNCPFLKVQRVTHFLYWTKISYCFIKCIFHFSANQNLVTIF